MSRALIRMPVVLSGMFFRLWPFAPGRWFVWKWVAKRLPDSDLELVVKSRDNIRYCCRHGGAVQRYMIHFGVWEPHLTKFLKRTLGKDDVLVDIGANVGYFTLLGARLVGPGGGVVAIDASPRAFGRLERNVRLNGCGNVRTVNMAVADRRGTLTLYGAPEDHLGQSTTSAGRGFAVEAEVEAAPLIDILRPEELARTRVIKIDAEGAELEILQSLLKDLDRFPDTVELVVELTPAILAEKGTTPRALLEQFAAVGFHPYLMRTNRMAYYLFYDPDAPSPVRRLDFDNPGTDAEILAMPHYDVVLSRRDAAEL